MDKSSDPKEWGPSVWFMLKGLSHLCHCFWGRKAWELITATANVLPCETCEKNFKAFIRRNPITHSSAQETGSWLRTAQNEVNAREDKKQLEECEFRAWLEKNVTLCAFRNESHC